MNINNDNYLLKHIEAALNQTIEEAKEKVIQEAMEKFEKEVRKGVIDISLNVTKFYDMVVREDNVVVTVKRY